VEAVFDLEHRLLFFEVVLKMRDASLNEEVDVAEGAQEDQGIEELFA
jgi:hypothetical protein